MFREGRPDPDALLADTKAGERGRLKVFLGAAPGVGKTYAMLSAAGRLARAQLDVVVGVVETHGRHDTEALLDGLELLPRRAAPYAGSVLQEFDLDAALARRPALLIVDELAHTNAPGSRHPKRYQDVAELLEAGLDVWTAMNIQHLEGLSDVVTRITGVTVREIVPDTVIDGADEVVVVDITPAELIGRLNEGRIYRLDTVQRAAAGFFKPGNLAALRELALRCTADRVDDQVLDHLRRHAVEGAWPSGERLLVCVGADLASEHVIRVASRLAGGLNAPWTAVTLEATGREIIDEGALRRIDASLRLAERLGADTQRLSGPDLPEAALRFARRTNVTQIVIGRSCAGWYARWRGRSLSDAILRQAHDIAIHVVIGAGMTRPPRWRWRWPDANRWTVDGGIAVTAVALVVGFGMDVPGLATLANLPMLFLASVLICAVTRGPGSAVLAALLAFLAYNFFFIPPVFTLTVAEPHEWVALVVFLLVAGLTGGLAGRVRRLADAARNRVAAIQALYDMSRKLSETSCLDDVLWVVAHQAAAIVAGEATVLLPGENRADLEIRAAFPPNDVLAPGEQAAARWAFDKGELAGWRTATLPHARLRFQPIRAGERILGALGIEPTNKEQILSKEAERQLAALLEQGGIAIERAQLSAEARRSATALEREQLQATLLSSLSHDLRTPLAAILGAASGLRSYSGALTEVDRADMLATIEEEARRMSRFVSNLLDMTRVESGAAGLRRDLIDIGEILASAVARARKLFPGRRIDLRLLDELPPLRGDALLLEQVIFNLLDNADRYSAPGTATRVAARLEGGAIVVITVEDQGRGIPPGDLTRVFDKFTRLDAGDGRPAGTGLGLAIAKGAIMGMGGAIGAESPAANGVGTRLVLRLPAEVTAPATLDPLEDVL